MLEEISSYPFAHAEPCTNNIPTTTSPFCLDTPPSPASITSPVGQFDVLHLSPYHKGDRSKFMPAAGLQRHIPAVLPHPYTWILSIDITVHLRHTQHSSCPFLSAACQVLDASPHIYRFWAHQASSRTVPAITKVSQAHSSVTAFSIFTPESPCMDIPCDLWRLSPAVYLPYSAFSPKGNKLVVDVVHSP
jgi:hypothetical protein